MDRTAAPGRPSAAERATSRRSGYRTAEAVPAHRARPEHRRAATRSAPSPPLHPPRRGLCTARRVYWTARQYATAGIGGDEQGRRREDLWILGSRLRSRRMKEGGSRQSFESPGGRRAATQDRINRRKGWSRSPGGAPISNGPRRSGFIRRRLDQRDPLGGVRRSHQRLYRGPAVYPLSGQPKTCLPPTRRETYPRLAPIASPSPFGAAAYRRAR
jgi:hypothetical protein